MGQQESPNGASPLVVIAALAGVAAAVGAVVFRDTAPRAVLIALSVILFATAGNAWRSRKNREAGA
ncbi:hypothetical protein GCM10009544_09270 [Streptomyces stramineus]|uniref:Uncharacterized protein n=1 Tax=Streptomyces stramineus TaxID=173861 RepID=A0ABN0ZIH1_9ACTN